MHEALDTAGQDEYTTLGEQWIRDYDGALVIYYISSKSIRPYRKFLPSSGQSQAIAKSSQLACVGNDCGFFYDSRGIQMR
jgi:GTPase SAR1 family protein